jgi:hypothetical protein
VPLLDEFGSSLYPAALMVRSVLTKQDDIAVRLYYDSPNPSKDELSEIQKIVRK